MRNASKLYRTVAIIMLLCTIFSISSCGNSDENKAIARIKAYMKAEETGDQKALLECMDPAIQEASKGFTNTVAGFFGIDNGYDLGNAFGTLMNGARNDLSAIDIKYKFEKVYKSEMKEDKGSITVQYQLNISGKSDKSKTITISVIIPFDMIKREKDWYVSTAGEAIMIKDADGNEYKPPKIKIDEGRAFSNGVAWIKSSGIWKCIDKNGDVQFSLEKGQTPITDFDNDIAAVSGTDYKRFVVNKTGEIVISPEKQGFDTIVIATYNKPRNPYMWSGKAVRAYKKLEKFDKSETQAGILNNKGEWIHPLSSDSQGVYGNYYATGNHEKDWIRTLSSEYGTDKYYNPVLEKAFYVDGSDYESYMYFEGDTGIILDRQSTVHKVNSDGVTDIKIVEDVRYIGELNEGMFFAMKNDGSKAFYDIDGNMKIELTQYKIYCEYGEITDFPVMEKGYALLEILNPSGSKYITVIDKEGNQMFEPLEIYAVNRNMIDFGNDGFIEYYNTSQETNIIDLNGNSKFQDIAKITSNMGDGAVMVSTTTTEGIYYIDLQGNKLF